MGVGQAVTPSDSYQKQTFESINGWLSAQEHTLQNLQRGTHRSTCRKRVATAQYKSEDGTPLARCALKENASLGQITGKAAAPVCGYANKATVARSRDIFGHNGLSGHCRNKQDFDQGSITSFDDDVSISDSAHESQSSESSTSSSWTNATEPVDFFQRDDTKVQPPAGHLELCSSPSESSEQLFKEVEAKEERRCRNRPSSDQDCDSVTSFSSAASRSQSLDETTFLPYVLSQSSNKETAADLLASKTNIRRPSTSTKSLSGPCKLKRDTDVTEQFVSLLIIFATRLITAIWPMSACPPMTSTCFNGAGVLPLRVFIQETLRRSKSSYSTLQVALYYLVLLKGKLSCGQASTDADGEDRGERSRCRAMQCGRRMFLSALMLASKYLQDRNYSARAWSKISGLRSNEINENERNYLKMIDYELHVPKEQFDVWSKIVLSLSRLSKEQPRCQPGSPDSGYSSPGSGSSNSLAEMVSQVDLEEPSGQQLFSDSWWCGLIKQLDPLLVKDTELAHEFLRKNLPQDHVDLFASWTINKLPSQAASPEPTPGVYDMNFSDTLKSRPAEVPQTSASQVLTQMSPAGTTELPMRPHLGNLPTPQTTPRVADNHAWSANNCSRTPLRCSASVDALRNMRRQCFMNANLERCPPPRPQGCALPPMRSLLRPAETLRENSSKSTTPCTSSPLSVITETTPSLSRSRSSSISSNSSWTSPMRLRGGCGEPFNSSLSRVCSSSDEYGRPASTVGDRATASIDRSSDEEYSSGEELRRVKTAGHQLRSSSDIDAAQLLVSLSTHSETSSQSTTPTPRLLSEQGTLAMQSSSDSPRGHKRTLSKADHNLRTQVRDALTTTEVMEDPLQPFYDTTPKQWQVPTRSWAGPRRALPNSTDNKRLASYCSIQQFTSAPDLAARYLKESMLTAP